LPELARAYGVDVIADSYWCAERPSGVAAIAGSAPLFEVLDRLAGDGHAWDRREGLIRFRDRKWFQDRPSEIPLRTVRRWMAVTDRLGALPVAEFASLAETLTEFQFDLLFNRWVFPPQLEDLRFGISRGGLALERSRHLLRLYARLAPAQQQALWEGKPLAVAQLPPALRPLVVAQLQRIARTADNVQDLERWGDGHITFTRKPDVRIRERRGQTVTYRLESEGEPRAAPRPDEVARFPIAHLEMRIHYGPEKSYALPLIVAAGSAPPE
jgi:hypothetical protein